MAYYSKYTGAELEERLDKVEEIPQLIAQMITGKDFVTKEDLLCVLKDYAPATYATIPIDNNTIYWENGVLKAATSDGGGQCQWELREHNGIQYLYSRLPVVTQYDVTMYADVNHLDLPSIYDGLPIDGDTIYWEETENGRILKSKYEGSSGVDASEVLSIVSGAGYATQNWVNNQSFITQSYLATELLKYVTLDNYQEIIGVKNFINGLQISNIPIKKLEGYDDILYIDSNVVIRGGLTMYYEDGEINLPSIKEEIGNAGYDGVTGLASFDSSQFYISSDGTVTIIGGSAGLDTAQLAEYLTTNKYATQGWITEQNYASASNLTALQSKVDNFLEGSDSDTIINKWLELEAFLSGLSESDNLATILSNKANKSTTLAGYGITDAYTKTQVDNTFKLYIPIAGYTEITGEKNFTGGLRVNNSPSIYYDETNKYWKLEGDLLVTGGVTMYGADGSDFGSIFDGIPIDGDTIYWSNGVLKAKSGSNVSTLGSLLNVDSVSVDATATVDRVLFQQAGSATWVTKPLSEIGGGSSGGGSVSGDYLPLSGGTLTGTVTFQTNGNSAFNINEIGEGNAGFSFQKNGSTLGAIRLGENREPSWMYSKTWTWETMLHSGNYSSYALPLSGGTVTGIVSFSKSILLLGSGNGTYNIGEINSTSTGGLYIEAPLSSDSWGASRLPITLSWRGGYDNHGGLRITNSDEAYLGGNKILHAGNYSSYALPLSGGTLDGALTVHGKKEWSIYAETSASNVCASHIGGYGMYIGTSSSSSSVYALRVGGSLTGASNIFFTVNANGNVGIGTTNPQNKLDVNGYVEANSFILDGYGAQTFTIGVVGVGAGGLYLEGPWYDNTATQKLPIIISWRGGFNNQGGIKLDASANMLVTGGITMYSDQRKKTKLQDVELSLSQIANAPLIQHYYNSDQNKTTHVGSIAQYWAGLNDWFCKLDNEGYYTMEIQNAALASAISIARHLEKYESKTDKKIRQLKKRISQLEDELELLKKGV